MEPTITTSAQSARGRVFLVGAGPGDPELITVRGLRCLQQADVILYDYLANPRLLQGARPEAEKICLGRHGHGRIWTQDEIHTALIDHARQGRSVVRLKGGDPAVFARSGDEVEALVAAGIDFEIVPGITASLAAGSYAGIPLTHRDHASAVALVTGHEDEDKTESVLDYSALAQFPGTLVFYMGITTAPTWTAALLGAGKPATTPVAIVRRCSCADQEVIRCPLGELVSVLERPPRIRPPAVIIVGSVAGTDPALTWFERRPLFGRRVLVTRPREQAAPLVQLLESAGADVLEQPAIEIDPPRDWKPVDAVLQRLGEFDWLVFSSSNGVRLLLERLPAIGRDLRALAQLKLAAIGPGTAEELRRFHLQPDLIPPVFRAESLAEALAGEAAGKRMLLARASRGREVLADSLRAAGAAVEQVVVYESIDVATPDEEVLRRMSRGQIEWVTITSSAIARSTVRLFGESLRSAKLASISPITTETLRSLGFEPDAEAAAYTMEGVVEAILQAEAGAK